MLKNLFARRCFSALSKARTPMDGKFNVLEHISDGAGGGSLLFELELGGAKRMRAETVVISHQAQPWQKVIGSKRSAAVCVSSQAGCALDCTFCDTGRVLPASNLPAWGILEQVRAAQRLLNPDVGRVVFMGMGEPLMNYSEVSAAITTLRLDDTFARPWAITVSTVGVVPRIALLANDHPEVALALSLHAPTQDLRKQLLPASASRWPLDIVMDAVEAHGLKVGRVPMFAYIVLPGINDSESDACQLAQLLCGPQSKTISRPFVNLVPYNPTTAGELLGYRPPTKQELRAFRTSLRSKGIRTTVRWSTVEGRPFSAACGQLTARGSTASVGEQLKDKDLPLGCEVTRVKQLGQNQDACSLPTEEVLPVQSDACSRELDSPAAPVLTRQLSEARSCDDLLNLIKRHSLIFNEIHISAALVTLARSASRSRAVKRQVLKDERFTQFLKRTSELLPSFRAQACANALWALGKLKFHPGAEFMTELVDVSKKELEAFWPQNLANSLWAYAKVNGLIDESFVQSLVQAALPKLPLFTPVELANSAWALSELRHSPDHEFMQAWFNVAGQKLVLFKPQDLATCLWALAKLGQSPSEQFLDSILCRSEANPVFKPKEIANSSWACERLSYPRGKEFFDALATRRTRSSNLASEVQND